MAAKGGYGEVVDSLLVRDPNVNTTDQVTYSAKRVTHVVGVTQQRQSRTLIFLPAAVTVYRVALYSENESSKHQSNTRFASRLTYYINPARTNFGKFDIRFAAAAV